MNIKTILKLCTPWAHSQNGRSNEIEVLYQEMVSKTNRIFLSTPRQLVRLISEVLTIITTEIENHTNETYVISSTEAVDRFK